MQSNPSLLSLASFHVRRYAPGAFSVVAITHIPFLFLLFAVLSAFFQGGRYLLPASVGAALFLALCLFAALPMGLALSGYFIALSKGRNPRFLSIFGVFSDYLQYRHALLTTLAVALSILLPASLCLLPLLLLPSLPAWGAYVLLIACVLCALFVLLRRMLSLAFAGHFAWEYPYLTPREAVRLSFHVTKGRRITLLRTLLPLAVLLLFTVLTLGILSFAVLPFFYTALALCYLDFKQCEGVNLPSPKEYADV